MTDPDDALAADILAAARREVRRQKRRRASAAAKTANGPVRVVGYVRVSTEEQGDLGAGLEAQRRAISAACSERGWELSAILEDVASGKSVSKRPGLEEAMATIRRGDASGLVVAKLDRLSRSVIDAARTIEDARREGWNLVALDLGVDFSTAAGTAMAQMTAVFAELERRLIGERTRAALAVKKAQGVRLGRPPVVADAVRRGVRRERDAGSSLRAIAERLNRTGVPTAHGGAQWHASTVLHLLATRA